MVHIPFSIVPYHAPLGRLLSFPSPFLLVFERDPWASGFSAANLSSLFFLFDGDPSQGVLA